MGRKRPCRLSLVILLSALSASSLFPAETKRPFTIEDYFLTRSARVEALTEDGRFLAATLVIPKDHLPRDNARYGDPTYIGPSQAELLVIDTGSGRQVPVFAGKRHFRSPVWSRDGQTLAFFVLEGGRFRMNLWRRETGKLEPVPLPKDRHVASNSPLIWSPDGTKIYLTTRAADWEVRSAALFKNATSAPVIVMDTDNPFLQWEEIRRMDRLVIPAVWDFKARNLTELMPETPLLSLRLTKDGTALLFERDVTEKTNYDIIFGTKNQLEVLPLPSGPARVLLKPYEQRSLVWARDSKTLAYTDKEDIFVMSIEDKEPRRLTGEKESEAAKDKEPGAEDEKKEEKDKKKKPAWKAARFSPDAAAILATSARVQEDEPKDRPGRRPSPPPQYWIIDVKTGGKYMFHELPEDEDSRPDLQVVDWSPDGASIYFSTSAPDRYDRGLVRFDLASKRFTDLRRSPHLFRNWQMSEDGTRFVFTESDGDHPDDLFAADAGFSTVRQLTELNLWLADRALSRTELVSYLDADGRKLYGVLYYPANYEQGKRYPLVTEVYERYFDNGFNGALNVLTSAGYAVLHPSVNFNTGYPGEAWAKGALAAVNKVIDMGVADPDRLGIQGTSYGAHGGPNTNEERADMYKRMIDWYDKYLKAEKK